MELKDDAKPVRSQPYPVPRIHKAMFIKEAKRLLRLGVIKEANDYEWGAIYFAQPKAKTNRVIFLSDFWNLNRQLKLNPYPMSKICERILKLEGFKYTTSLDLNMGYYHIRLSKKSRNIYIIIPPWGKY